MKVKRLFFESPSLNKNRASMTVDIYAKDLQKAPRVAWFSGERSFYNTDAARCFDELNCRVERTTIYERTDALPALSLKSPEHLAPVFLMWPTRLFDVHLLEGEVPLMDGSAMPFFTALRQEAGVPEDLAFYDAPVNAGFDLVRDDRSGATPYGSVRIRPSETFEVEYTIERPSGFTSASSVSVYTGEDLYRILLSRTFIFQRDLDEACAAGLLSGVDETCGLLLSEDSLEARKLYRTMNEPACHKILDLIGDLCFVRPALPKIRIEIINGGHISHREILRRILPYAIQ